MKVKYSFITPRKKMGVDNFTIFGIGFIIISSIIFFFFGLYLSYVNNRFDYKVNRYKSKIAILQEKKAKINSQINKYLKIVNIEKRVNRVNDSLKNGLKNFFVLIPDQIKIKKLYLTKYEVKIYGEVDNPSTYKLLLEPPLKSIFDKTKVGFTKIDDKRYIFSSSSQIKGIKHE